ncbi:MAG TPA: tetraacyldisaccharide 4'-kinase [Steroidobacteraceae bacterium]|jgi:tetraacyldisaccharide 4'-kinase|nr:tetraacyldisaccharide 4'-kinase [Steroidobacteraceae bacterium]
MVKRLHDWLIGTWYGGSGRGRWLLPFAWLFAGASALRRWLYERGILARYRSPRLVVIVGNLTVGGAGKTPFVIWLAGELERMGLRAGVAMRGYKGAGGRPRRLTDTDSASDAGDEPWMIRRRLTQPVAVAARRADAVRLLEPDCDVIVCDDGLQHYALARDVEIAVVDGMRGLGNGRRLPAGPLRETASRLEEVDAIVVNGPGFDRPGAIRMRLEPVGVVAFRDGSRRPLSDFAGREVVAAAAIGNPERFFAMLREHGLRIETRTLPDHARFTPALAGAGRGKPVLLTEKDAVKCNGVGWSEAGYVEVAPRVESDSASALLQSIAKRAAEKKERGRE